MGRGGQIPAYMAHYDDDARVAAALPAMELALQVLQWQDRRHGRPVRRWLLKSPANLERLPALLRRWPDARVVLLHRAPVDALESLLTLLTYSAGMHSDHVDPAAFGAAWVARSMGLVRRAVAQRRAQAYPAASVLDVHSYTFFADNLGVFDAVAAFAQLNLTAAQRAAAVAYIKAHPRQGAAAVRYDLGLFNLTRAGVEAQYAALLAEYDALFLQ